MLKIAEFSQKKELIKEKASMLLNEMGHELKLDSQVDRPVRIVFVGQYSSGKSTIVKMLTGDENIQIGKGITTQDKKSYMWNGIEIIDTPGINTGLRPDHDKITFDAIKSADMLIFVVTHSGFDEPTANYFRQLALECDRVSEILLVVNQMEGTSLGNTIEQQEILKEDLRNVFDPYPLEKTYLSFTDAKSYLEAKEVEDDEYSKELIEQSGYCEFIDNLNRFVDEKKDITRSLTTTLHEIDDQLEKCIIQLKRKSEDEDLDALEENYRQQREEIFSSRDRIKEEIKNIYSGAVSQIRSIGYDCSNSISLASNNEETEIKYNLSVENANNIITNCEEQARITLEKRLEEIDKAVDMIVQSPVSNKLITRLESKYEKLPNNIKNILGKFGKGAEKVGTTVVKHAYNTSAQGGFKLKNFSGSNIHELVKKWGNKFGYKFKPWQAVKITKKIAISGQILGVAGTGIDIFQLFMSEREETKKRKALELIQDEIRTDFSSVAADLKNYGEEFVRKNIDNPFEVSLEELDFNIQEIRKNKKEIGNYYIRLIELKRECNDLIRSINGSY